MMSSSGFIAKDGKGREIDPKAGISGIALCYIEFLEQRASENEKLQAQVAMLRTELKHLAATSGDYLLFTAKSTDLNAAYQRAVASIAATESDWLAQHNQQVRDEAYERVISEHPYLQSAEGKWLADSIRNLKGTK